jgi:hypothetical protein
MNVVDLVTGFIADAAQTTVTLDDRATKLRRDMPKAFIVASSENESQPNSEGVPYIAFTNASVRGSRTIVADVFGFLTAER